MDTTTNTPIDNSSILKEVAHPSDKQIIKMVDKIISSTDPLEYIERAKIDLTLIVKNLGRIATSAKIMAKDRDGDVFELGDDNRSQIAASLAVLELAKLMKDKTAIQQIAIVNDPGIIEDAKRIRGLKK